MEQRQDTSQRGQLTRQALIEAGCLLFGQKGFHLTGTRELASAAGVNQALIGFHFGGKEGLYSAVLDYVEAQLSARLMPSKDTVHGLQASEGTPEERTLCALAIGEMIDNLVDVLIEPELETWVCVILQEQQEDSAAHERVFDNFVAPHFACLLDLVSRLRPDNSETDNRLTTTILIGQVLAFRPARSLILKHMKWETIGPEQARAIKDAVRRNVTLPLVSRKE